MKKCMYTYHYYRNHAVMKRNRKGHRVFFWVIGIAAVYSAYCLSTLVSA